jgi:formyltetrahydrofolate synthetase
MKAPICLSYGKQYHKLDLKLYNSNRNLYELTKINIMFNEIQEKGFYISKWNKPTKKGTHITCKVITSVEKYEEELQKVKDYILQINKELDLKIVIEKAGAKQ